jgi:hypothetical protein
MTAEDREVLRSALLAEREAGVAQPLIAMDVDVDGDGICDSFGLDDEDRLIVVHGVALEATTYKAEGGGE